MDYAFENVPRIEEPQFGEFIFTNRSVLNNGIIMHDLTYVPPQAHLI
jgi:hypothetical protein